VVCFLRSNQHPELAVASLFPLKLLEILPDIVKKIPRDCFAQLATQFVEFGFGDWVTIGALICQFLNFALHLTPVD
jgi:hypothetical protein